VISVSSPGTLVSNLLQSAARFPERCAIQDGAYRLSYAGLAAQARAVAAELTRRGLALGDRAAIVLPNSGEFVAAYYGILMAGGTVVLLNPAAKSRDFEAWLRDCEAKFLFAESQNSEVARAVAAFGQPLEVLHASGNGPAAFGLEAGAAPGIPAAVEVDAPACILYTSGTTGRPKGVVLSHRNLAANCASICEYLALSENDSIVCVLPFCYSYGSSVLHTHVQAAGRIVLEKNFVYPHAVVETLARERATGFAGVPPTYALLLSRVQLGSFDLSALRYVTQAGGAMPPALTQRLRETLPYTQVFVMYGQTEATARLTWLPPDRLTEKMGSVGIPVPGVRIEIRGENGVAVPAGTVGEIWAHGDNIMLGYWRNAAATGEVLRDGWLKTGDMGRLDDQGFLFIVGRRSDMIKAGAHRIHPQDIEDAIAEMSDVEEAAAVGVDDDTLGQSVCVFVVPHAGAAVTAMQVQAHCRARLANYKIPKRVEIVATLPRTPSGKVRRAELAERAKQ
jgi:long-chain acyl-CoA synthetase